MLGCGPSRRWSDPRHAPATLRERRARERATADARGSDATPAVVARLGTSFSGWSERPEEAILTLRTGVPADRLVDQIGLVDQIADWLDTRASVVSRAATGLTPEVAGPSAN
jgi:hypothetical protein